MLIINRCKIDESTLKKIFKHFTYYANGKTSSIIKNNKILKYKYLHQHYKVSMRFRYLINIKSYEVVF